MKKLVNVSCGDSYTDAASILGVIDSAGGYFNISGADVFMRLLWGPSGQQKTTDEVHVPVGGGVLAAKTAGVQFRNFAAGSVATVSAALAEKTEPPIQIAATGVSAPSAVNVAAAVTSSVNFPVPSGALVFQTFDTISFDPFGMFSPSQPTRLTVPAGKAGLYLVGFQAEFSASAAGTFRQAVARLNGATVIAQDMRPPVAGGNVTITNFTTVKNLAAGDYIEIRLLQDSGVGLNSDAQPWAPIFSLAQLTA